MSSIKEYNKCIIFIEISLTFKQEKELHQLNYWDWINWLW